MKKNRNLPTDQRAVTSYSGDDNGTVFMICDIIYWITRDNLQKCLRIAYRTL